MILIRSVKVVDGTGKPAYTADVLVDSDKISAIGYFPNKTADLIIDGMGFYLMPGFIDVHTDSDHSLALFTNSGQKEFLLQGITTVVGGNCGSSLAPLLYGTLESIQKWADTTQINVNWNTVADFFKVLAKRKMGVNFSTLIGHSTVRRGILGEELRDLTDKEMAVFKKALEEALKEGGLGFSTGLSYAHSKGTPYNEIKTLVEVVKKYDGVYATHLRNEKEGLVDSVKETIRLAEETSVKTIISHLRPLMENENNFQEAIGLINKTKADLSFDVYPFDVSLTPIYTLLPQWVQAGGLSFMLSQLLDESVYGRIVKDLPSLKRDDLIIASAPGNEFLVGKTIGDIAKNQGVIIPEALLRIMITTRLKSLVFYKNLNQNLVNDLLVHPKSLITSNTIRLVAKAFFRFLELATAKMSVEEAIKKITSSPATKYNIKNRGVIKEGMAADLVLMRNPNQPSAEMVMVNGRLAVKGGEYQNILAGEIIKRE